MAPDTRPHIDGDAIQRRLEGGAHVSQQTSRDRVQRQVSIQISVSGGGPWAHPLHERQEGEALFMYETRVLNIYRDLAHCFTDVSLKTKHNASIMLMYRLTSPLPDNKHMAL